MKTSEKKFTVKFTGKEDIWTEIRETNYSNVEDVDLSQVFLHEIKPVGIITFSLVHFDRRMTGKGVGNYFNKHKLRPAGFLELLGFGRHYPNVVMNHFDIIGFSAKVDLGQGGFIDGMRIPVLHGDPLSSRKPAGEWRSLSLADYNKDHPITVHSITYPGQKKPSTPYHSHFLVRYDT